MAIEPIIPASLKSTYDSLHFAPAVRKGDMLYLSGVIASLRQGEEGTNEQFAEGAERAFQQIELVLEEAGASMADIVSITSFHIDFRKHIGPLAAVKDKWIKEPYPAWTVIGTTELFDPLGFVEIQVTAQTGA